MWSVLQVGVFFCLQALTMCESALPVLRKLAQVSVPQVFLFISLSSIGAVCHTSVCQDWTAALTSPCDNLSSSEGQGQWFGDSICDSEARVSWQQVHSKSMNVGRVLGLIFALIDVTGFLNRFLLPNVTVDSVISTGFHHLVLPPPKKKSKMVASCQLD